MSLEQRIKAIKQKTFYEPVEVTEVDSESSDEYLVVSGYANRYKVGPTVTVDRDGDSVPSMGIDVNDYLKNPIILLQHDRNHMIGKAVEVQLREDGLWMKMHVYKALNEKAYHAVRLGVLKAFSIGFIVKDLKYDEVHDVFILSSTVLLENSLVSIPSNQLSLVEEVHTPDGNLKCIKGCTADYLVKEMPDEVNSDLMRTLKDLEAKIDNILVKEEPTDEGKEEAKVEPPEVDVVPTKEQVVIPTITELATSAMVSADNFDELLIVQQTLTDKLDSFLQENL
jgi:HK97 family phage prohead protease